jgi:hypothetical protein
MEIYIYKIDRTDLQSWRLEKPKDTVNYKYVCSAKVEEIYYADINGLIDSSSDNTNPDLPPNVGEYGKVYMGPFVKIISIHP